VRGNPADECAPNVVSGIMMHRRVDVLADSQPQVKTCRNYFSGQHRRVAPITLDVVWDQFLARHWQQLEPLSSLHSFTQQARSQIVPYLPLPPPRFQNLNRYLRPERYAELPFIAKVLQSMATRRQRLAALSVSFSDIERHYPQLETYFWQFYPQILHQAKDKKL